MQIKLLALLAVIGGFIIGYIFSPVFGACFAGLCALVGFILAMNSPPPANYR